MVWLCRLAGATPDAFGTDLCRSRMSYGPEPEGSTMNLGLAAITGLAAALLTPVVWLALRLADLVPALALAADMRLWRLHLAMGLFGLVMAWGVSRLVPGFAERMSIPWMLTGGYVGAVLSSMDFFPLVALF